MFHFNFDHSYLATYGFFTIKPSPCNLLNKSNVGHHTNLCIKLIELGKPKVVLVPNLSITTFGGSKLAKCTVNFFMDLSGVSFF